MLFLRQLFIISLFSLYENYYMHVLNESKTSIPVASVDTMAFGTILSSLIYTT